jgi:adenylate cyclase
MNKKQAKQFQGSLMRYSKETNTAVRKEIEAELWNEYGTELVVFVLDMSGFSMLTRKHGIIHYLSMVRRMQLTTEPIIKSYGGNMIKYEADNCFAVFPHPLAAVQAAISMQHAFTASNILSSEDHDIHLACGIDYGKLLMIGNDECFGDPVNRASKMGEDVAASGEILVTKEAMEMIPAEAGIKSREISISISGITIPAYAIDYHEK